MNAFRALLTKKILSPREKRLRRRKGKLQREQRMRSAFRALFKRIHNHDPFLPREKVDHVVKPGTLLNWKSSPLGWRKCPMRFAKIIPRLRWYTQGEGT